ncbi:MAG: InlB B-repeat-containing protein [Eubacterium sp.]|nr:InlB B-repeat-containing protein [Eubacterium sp.]
MSEEDNPVAILSDVVQEHQDGPVDDSSNVIALIDSGITGYDDNVVDKVSVIGDNPEDENGHGTDMAKSIISQNKDAKIISIRALDETGGGSVASVISAMEYAKTQNCKYINLSMSAYSLESQSGLKAMIDECTEQGIVVTAAAGNNGKNVKTFVPGNIESAIVVGSLDEEGKRASFSNYGETVDFYVKSSSTSKAAAITTGLLSSAKVSGDNISKYAESKADKKDSVLFSREYVESSNKEEKKEEKKEDTKSEKDSTSKEQQKNEVNKKDTDEKLSDKAKEAAKAKDDELYLKIAERANSEPCPSGDTVPSGIPTSFSGKGYITAVHKDGNLIDQVCIAFNEDGYNCAHQEYYPYKKSVSGLSLWVPSCGAHVFNTENSRSLPTEGSTRYTYTAKLEKYSMIEMSDAAKYNRTFYPGKQMKGIFYKVTVDFGSGYPKAEGYIMFGIYYYNIEYYGNGGTGVPSDQEKLDNISISLRSTTPKKSPTKTPIKVTYDTDGGTAVSASTAYKTTEYKFKNWNTQKGGSGTSYDPGETYRSNYDLTLYAQYDPQTPTYSKVTLPSTSKTGYEFVEWVDDNGNSVGKAGDSVTITKNTTLTAKWSPISYSVEFDANGGDGSMQSQKFVYGTKQALTKNTFMKYHRDFIGWTDNKKDAGNEIAKYKDGESVLNLASTKNKTVTLYAVWKNYWKPVPIEYKKSDGSYIYDGNAHVAGSLTATDPTNATIIYIDNSGHEQPSVPSYKEEGSYKTKVKLTADEYIDTEVELTTVIKYENHDLTVDANDGLVDGKSSIKKADGLIYMRPDNNKLSVPTRKGYTFAGYYDAKTNGNKAYDDQGNFVSGKYFDNDGNYLGRSALTVYARWEAYPYTIRFDKNEKMANGQMADLKTSYDQAVSLPSTSMDFSGFNFIGWSTDPNATKADYKDGETVKNLTDKKDEVVTLYAVWEAIPDTAFGGSATTLSAIFGGFAAAMVLIANVVLRLKKKKERTC